MKECSVTRIFVRAVLSGWTLFPKILNGLGPFLGDLEIRWKCVLGTEHEILPTHCQLHFISIIG